MDRQMREMYVTNLVAGGGGRMAGSMAAAIARDIERFYINQLETGHLKVEETHRMNGTIIPGPLASPGELAEFAIECQQVWQYMPDKKINAIKELRAVCQVGLKEAKDAIELGQSWMVAGYMPKNEREKVEAEAVEAIASIQATMNSIREESA